jgi:hypothetical protein
MVLSKPYQHQPSAIASYNYTDISGGIGTISLYLTNKANATFKDYVLHKSALICNSTSGSLGAATYEFKSSKLTAPETIKGSAFLSGYVLTPTTFICKATMYISEGTLVNSGIGAITWTSDGEVSSSSGTYTLMKTITINGYVNKVTDEIKSATNGTGNKIQFNYTGGQNSSVTATSNSATYVEKTYTHANPTRKVLTIGVYGFTPGNAHFEQLTKVYIEKTSGLTETAISSEITSETLNAASGLLMEIPLTQTALKIGQRFQLNLVLSGTGSLIADPTNEFTTNQTAQLNIPFQINP